MPWQFSLVLLVIELLLQIAVYILLCQFFIKAAGKLVGKERVEKWKKILYLVGITALIALIVGSIILKVIEDEFKQTNRTVYICKTYLFWMTDLIMLMILLLFTYDSWEISAAIKEEIDRERSESDSSS